jgi:hydrogenase expression/formation protein HypE
MCGARPLYLSAAFILEEGLPMATLARVVASMKAAVDHAGVSIVTGDTKVVERGKGDGVFISMAGWGVVPEGVQVGPAQVQKGDAILLSGDVGRHGIAVMAAREGLSFETNLESDAADLSGLVMQMITAGLEIHCMRDLTRGGLASALNEIAKAAKLRILIEESSIPVCEPVRAACELLGLDPLYVANEGRFISFLPAEQVELAIEILHSSPLGEGACVIGQVGEDETPLVSLKTSLGVHRVLDLLSGEQLPRIC